MSASVLLLVASESHLEHAKALFVGAKRTGCWRGDFCLLCPKGTNTESIDGRGIYIACSQFAGWTNRIKHELFWPHFCIWQRLLYLDTDCLIQRDLNAAVAETFQPGKILMEGSQALEGGLGTTILQDWEHFARISGVDEQTRAAGLARLRERHPHVDSPLFASSVMLFNPADVPDDTVEALLEADAEFADLNPRGYDQQVMNLVLYGRMGALPKSFATWWAFDDPGNRVASEARGWRGGEFPAVAHYWGAFAPWLEKMPDAGAYFNERLGKSCLDVYRENLAAFEMEFPKR